MFSSQRKPSLNIGSLELLNKSRYCKLVILFVLSFNYTRQFRLSRTAKDGLHEIWLRILASLLFLILAEWGIYYYEQF